MIDKERIEKIRARFEAATPGPWYWRISNWGGIGVGAENGSTIATYTSALNAMNAKFIAHARQDVPDLLDELEEAQSYAAGIQAGVDHLREERDRLRETLERVELHAMWSYESGQDAAGKWHEVRFCVECGELFKRANGGASFNGKHDDECVFARVRGGD